MKTEKKNLNQTYFQNSNLLKKTIFRKWKQEIKTENKNVNQTHPSGGSTMRPAGAYARAQLGIFFGYKPNIFLLVLKNK